MNLSNKNIIHVINGEVEYLQFKKLLEYSEIKHAFGIKPLDYRAHGENNKEVPQAYSKLLKSLKIDYNSLVRPGQKHTNNVQVIYQKENIDAPDYNLKYLDETDGLITNKPNITLATTNADCIVLLFFDPVKKVIASVHSGWRGTFKKISQVTIDKMKSEFDCNPQDIIVCICPSIRACHFEVEDDVKEECDYRIEQLSQSFHQRELIIRGMIQNATDEKIIRMRTSQLNKLKVDYENQEKTMQETISKADIHTNLLVKGVLHVE